MDGIINVIKPPGMSSHQVVGWLRRVLQTRKIGHAGTLDPGASGVLVACVGKGTRVVPFLVDHNKRYVVELTFGITTSTQDSSGQTEQIQTEGSFTAKDLADVLASFRGTIDQIPPMASAVRINGQRLYTLERKGITVDRPSRKVQIHEIHVQKVWSEHPDILGFGTRVLLEVHCSKGTYIRTLCHDIGEKLALGAHLSFLTRSESGPFSISNGFTVEEIEHSVAMDDFRFLLPVTSAFPNWIQVRIPPAAETAILNGNYLYPEDFPDFPDSLTVGEQFLILDQNDHVLAFGEMRVRGDNSEQLICQPIRVLREGR